MASPMPWHDFRRKFKKFDVELTVKGSHVRMRKVLAGECVLYTAVVHKKKVDPVYVHRARRVFRLLPVNGVTDQEFKSA